MRFPILIAALLAGGSLVAQFRCGAPNEPDSVEIARYQRLMHIKTAARQEVVLQPIPIKPHLFTDDDGSNAPSFTQLNDALAELNRQFQEMGIVFYFSGTVFDLYADSVFNNGQMNGNDESAFHEAVGVNDAMNLYVAETVMSGGASVGGWSFVAPQNQQQNRLWVVTGQLNDDKTTPHEFGHYFSLHHTFRNSDSDITGQRERVTRNFDENPPRLDANCEAQGDYLCDTESDPFNVSPAAASCLYDGTETDVNGDLFHPQVNNYMDYRWCPPYEYTPGQRTRIQDGALLVSNAADFTLDAPQTDQLPPTGLAVAVADYAIVVSWQDVSAVETGYLIERGLTASGPWESVGGVAADAQSFADLGATTGTSYHYRVKPSNSAGNYSAVAGPVTAPGCGNLSGQTCMQDNDPDDPNWNIENFTLTDNQGTSLIANLQSGCSNGGQGNFYNTTAAAISPGEVLHFTAASRQGSNGSAYNVAGKIWVDWNRDLVFGPDELMYADTDFLFLESEGTFTVPSILTDGDYRLRVGLTAGNLLEPCGVAFGELEDYRLTYSALGTTTRDAESIRPYPNPTGNRLFLSGNLTGISALTLFDLTGKRIFTTTEFSDGVDVSALAQGVYLLRLERDGTPEHLRFVKR